MARRNGWSMLAVGAVLVAFTTRASAQVDPWVSFVDEVSGGICSIVNSANAEFVVLASTGELVLVTGPDTVLETTFVDDARNVIINGQPSGLLDFANDQFGFPKLFWFDADGFMMGIDPATGDLVTTTTTPAEIDGECAACEQWDDPTDCGGAVVDTDSDGVDDEFDLCDNTPPGETADVHGCSCGQKDGDNDGIDDCIDLCPDTLPVEIADDRGCACSELDEDDDGIDDCSDECASTPPDEVADEFGCSCSAYDSDGDGVDDCADDCPNTQVGDGVDLDGCSEGDIITIEPPGLPGPVLCGSFSALTMMGLLAGLCSMRLVAHRFGGGEVEDRPRQPPTGVHS